MLFTSSDPFGSFGSDPFASPGSDPFGLNSAQTVVQKTTGISEAVKSVALINNDLLDLNF